jgi:hypothetical protein
MDKIYHIFSQYDIAEKTVICKELELRQEHDTKFFHYI